MTPSERLNHFANLPEIIRALAPGYDTLDLSPFLRRPDNIAFVGDKGAAIFGHAGDHVYEGHYLFPDNFRGPEAKAYARACVAEMFDKHGALTIIGHVPEKHFGARYMSRAIGCTPRGNSVDTLGRTCIVYMLEREEWAAQSAESSAV